MTSHIKQRIKTLLCISINKTIMAIERSSEKKKKKKISEREENLEYLW
jgi:hypothetical protein